MAERAELVGGRLGIESVPGAGTTLRALFPPPSAGTEQ
jgi:signal transduction histidine kinase